MEKFLFIKVERVKSDLKFRFYKDQDWKVGGDITKPLSSTSNIRIVDGKKMNGFKFGAIYYIPNEPYTIKVSSRGGGYSVSRWRCSSLDNILTKVVSASILTSYEDDVLAAWNNYNSSLIHESEATTDSPEPERTDTYYAKLKTEFSTSKPKISTDGFYMSDSDWMILIRNIKQNINTLITGPTGSGKTTAIKLACEKLGIPCSVYDMGSMFDPISSLLGVHRLSEGSSKFDYAKFAQDIQKPGVILLDELSRAPIQSNNILFPCLDDRRTLPVEIAGCKDVRSIRIHPEVCFIATANIGAEYTGTNIMDRALQNRFFPIELDYLDKKNESLVLQKRCDIDKEDANLIVRVASEIRGIYKKQELSVSVGTRETLMAANLVKDGWSIKDALSMVFLPLFEGTSDPTEESTERGKIRKLLMTF